MAGHSQFKNIMYRKGAQDAKKAKMFAKIGRELSVSVKTGGADPASNPRLRLALIAARSANMPKDNVDRAIKKALGADDNTNYEEFRYEGYGPNGTAFIVEILTDNRNRTASDVRSAFNKHGGNLGELGSVSFMFDRLGLITYPKDKPFDTVFDAAVLGGAINVEETADIFEITCQIEDFANLRDSLTVSLGEALEAKVIWKPKVNADCDADAAKSVFKLIDALEDNDDVQNVYTNMHISDDILKTLSE